MLNLPIDLSGKENILLCGIGGGFDIFVTLPLYYTLTQMGKKCFFHSHQFTNLLPSKVGEDCFYGKSFDYIPEIHLSRFLKQEIYINGRVGASQLRESYKEIVKRHNIDHIIMVDGGVDSLMRGDEQNPGTITEEFIAFAALKYIQVPKTLMCMGFGCEKEEKISHYRVLENIAFLIREGAFIGSCSMTKDLQSFKFYRSAYEYVDGIPNHKKSHIHPRIISAVEGVFDEVAFEGETVMKNSVSVLLSPLMGVMWFFNGDIVIKKNDMVSMLELHKTFLESLMTVQTNRSNRRNHQPIPY